MKKAVNVEKNFFDIPLKEQISAVKKAGFDGVFFDWEDTEEYTITAGTITALPSTIEKNGKYHIGGAMTWDAAYYYCEALSKIDDSITGMAVKKDSFEPFGVDGFSWLNTLQSGGSTPTSGNECRAFLVYLYSGGVYNDFGREGNYYAMCE